MKAAIHLILVTALSCAGIALGCDGDDEQTTTGTTTTTGTDTGTDTGTTTDTGEGGGGGGTGAPLVPELGERVDRMGRPAINAALNATFEGDPTVKDAQKDAWNMAPEGEWADFAPAIASTLGILDSLDAECGNQLLAEDMLSPDRYKALSLVLTSDKLWLKLNALTCQEYLGVEAAVTGQAINDCGGRRLSDDVIDRSYSVLAFGVLAGAGDDIAANPDKTAAEAFPFLAPPSP